MPPQSWCGRLHIAQLSWVSLSVWTRRGGLRPRVDIGDTPLWPLGHSLELYQSLHYVCFSSIWLQTLLKKQRSGFCLKCCLDSGSFQTVCWTLKWSFITSVTSHIYSFGSEQGDELSWETGIWAYFTTFILNLKYGGNDLKYVSKLIFDLFPIYLRWLKRWHRLRFKFS